MSDDFESATPPITIQAPFDIEIRLEVLVAGELKLMRLRLREGRRHTVRDSYCFPSPPEIDEGSLRASASPNVASAARVANAGA